MSGECSAHVGAQKKYRKKISFGRCRRVWVEKIQTHLKEIGRELVDKIHLSLDNNGS